MVYQNCYQYKIVLIISSYYHWTWIHKEEYFHKYFYWTYSDKSIRSKVFIAAYFRAVKTTVALGYTTVMIFLSCSQGKRE